MKNDSLKTNRAQARPYMLFLIFAVAIHGCTAKKHLVSRTVSDEWPSADQAARTQFFDQMQMFDVDFSTFSARAKGFLTVNDRENHEVTVHLRMEKNVSVWVSVTAFMGMEIGRVLITPDSIRIMNRMDGTFMARPFMAMGSFTGGGLTFSELQRLLIGNVPDPVDAADMELALFLEGGALRDRLGTPDGDELHFDQNYRLVTYKRAGGAFEINHQYPAEDLTIPPGFPIKTSIAVKGERLKLTATIDYNRLILNQPVELPFQIPKGYDQIHGYF